MVLEEVEEEREIIEIGKGQLIEEDTDHSKFQDP